MGVWHHVWECGAMHLLVVPFMYCICMMSRKSFGDTGVQPHGMGHGWPPSNVPLPTCYANVKWPIEVGHYHRPTVSGDKYRSCVKEKYVVFFPPTKVDQQIFWDLFENLTTYWWDQVLWLVGAFCLQTCNLWNDVVTIKLIEVYEVNWFLYDPGDPNYQSWVLSVNMMICTLHIIGLQALVNV